MTKEQAQNQLREFFKGIPMLTFSVKEFPNNEWVAQCNEIESIITGGENNRDMAEMEHLMQDAILTAAGIPNEFSEGLLKRVWAKNDINVPVNTEISSNASVRLYPSIYEVYAGVGQI